MELISLLKPREGFFVTPILIYLNIVVFVTMVFAGVGFIDFRGQALLDWGANVRPLTRNWQYWRLFTCIFVHGGLMHLVTNMVGLAVLGFILEPLFTSGRLLKYYLVTGLLASITSMCWYSAAVSIGASGAIMGLYGILLALLATKSLPENTNKSLLTGTLIFIGLNLFFDMTGGTAGIDNAAHIGGLASGFVGVMLFNPRLKGQPEEETVY